jgi:hypothetical protein
MVSRTATLMPLADRKAASQFLLAARISNNPNRAVAKLRFSATTAEDLQARVCQPPQHSRLGPGATASKSIN